MQSAVDLGSTRSRPESIQNRLALACRSGSTWGGGGSIRDRPGPSRGRPAVGPRSGIDPGPIRIDQESTWCRFGIDAGRFRVDPGSILVDLDSTCSRQSIRNRLAFDTDRPGSNQTRSGSTRGVDPDRPGIDQGSTRSRRSIRDRSGVDPDRSGIDTGSIRIDRDRSGVGPGSAWDRPSFSPQSIRIDRHQPGIEPVPIRNDAPTQNTNGRHRRIHI